MPCRFEILAILCLSHVWFSVVIFIYIYPFDMTDSDKLLGCAFIIYMLIRAVLALSKFSSHLSNSVNYLSICKNAS